MEPGRANKQGLVALEAIHCRTTRVIHNLPWKTPFADVPKVEGIKTAVDFYGLEFAALIPHRA